MISLVTAVIGINSSVLAQGINPIPLAQEINPIPVVRTLSKPLGCTISHTKEFTQSLFATNTTSQTIGSGKILFVRVYYYGKLKGQLIQYTLTTPLAPGKSVEAGQLANLEVADNYTCRAYY
jgi:hypothetical protein